MGIRRRRERYAWIDRTFHGDRERYCLERILCGRDRQLEPNPFPYSTPPCVEHWLFWSRKPLDDAELCRYVESWLDGRMPHRVKTWNFDDNRGRRTIDIWHVHIYFQGARGKGPLVQCREPRRRGASA